MDFLAVKPLPAGWNGAGSCTGLCTLLTGLVGSSPLISAASLPETRCTDTGCMGIGMQRVWVLGQLRLSLAGAVDVAAPWGLRVSRCWFGCCQAQGQAGAALRVRSSSGEETLAGGREEELQRQHRAGRDQSHHLRYTKERKESKYQKWQRKD